MDQGKYNISSSNEDIYKVQKEKSGETEQTNKLYRIKG
jgi:hypothetical protein